MHHTAPGQVKRGRAIQRVGVAARRLRGDEELTIYEKPQAFRCAAQMHGRP